MKIFTLSPNHHTRHIPGEEVGKGGGGHCVVSVIPLWQKYKIITVETYSPSFYMCYSDHWCEFKYFIPGVSLRCLQALHFPQLHIGADKSEAKKNVKEEWREAHQMVNSSLQASQLTM